MSWIDWLIVLLLNGSVIGCGLYLARGTKTSGEWFLGGRALPWWGVGLSMFATNVDSADLVSVAGSTYNQGLHIISVYAVGSALGGILAAFLIVPAIYRAGFYTNAEYLEARYGKVTRILSALIQIQYRSTMLGLMIWSMFILLHRLAGLNPVMSGLMVVGMVVFSGMYTAWGGLRSVVWTDAMQSMIMMAGGLVIFASAWQAVGGWSAMGDALAEQGRAELVHIGQYRGGSGMLAPLVVVLGWTILGSGYWTVNHTQTMRLMGSRSLWDMKMAALLGVAVSLPIMIATCSLGLFGRALYPALEDADLVFPHLAADYMSVGLKGLVVAGMVAAGISTFDSMGSALSAIFTRDIYARWLVPDGEDRHYVRVSRWATVGILCLGFAYLPFIRLQKNMLQAFTTLVPVFVTPLFTIYVLGVATRAHRKSGLVGLIVGSAYGLVAFYAREAGKIEALPDLRWLPWWFTDRWPAFAWSMLFTSLGMLAATAVCGLHPRGEIAEFRETGWLERSREGLPQLRETPFSAGVPVLLQPRWYALLLLAFCGYVVFVAFW